MLRKRWNTHEGNPKGLVSNWVNLVRHTRRLVRALMDDTEWVFGAEDRKSAPERAPSWNEINIPSLGRKLLCLTLKFDWQFLVFWPDYLPALRIRSSVRGKTRATIPFGLFRICYR